jgi:predicted cobalt transporter CbtA
MSFGPVRGLPTLQDDAIAGLTGFVEPRLSASFGLPPVLPAQGGSSSPSRP